MSSYKLDSTCVRGYLKLSQVQDSILLIHCTVSIQYIYIYIFFFLARVIIIKPLAVFHLDLLLLFILSLRDQLGFFVSEIKPLREGVAVMG